ncbi:hypothetical protein CN172_17245 [Sinorhizobium meliloti]|nr:hypothetical protein CN232_33050 [Sinorhizobium meliloti]RVH41850.1 hypothetical protein CN208_20295 [Sinorhizobium meliloti]RVK12899.1 hypothetical protein CN172_17245 [Sinorhizobium meliloti]
MTDAPSGGGCSYSGNREVCLNGSTGSKGAVLHEPCARLVARMCTFWAKKIAYCITGNRVAARRHHERLGCTSTEFLDQLGMVIE